MIRSERMWSAPLLWLLLCYMKYCMSAFSNNSEIEETLETEIIYSEPQSFADKTSALEFLVVRQSYATRFQHFDLKAI